MEVDRDHRTRLERRMLTLEEAAAGRTERSAVPARRPFPVNLMPERRRCRSLLPAYDFGPAVSTRCDAAEISSVWAELVRYQAGASRSLVTSFYMKG